MKSITDIAKTIEETLNAARVVRDISDIHGSDRYSTFPAFHRTARHVAGLMRRAGMEQVEHLKYPTKPGKYGDWPAPIGWDATRAVLRLARGRRKGRVFLDLKNSPCHLVIHSGATPPGGVFSRIVRSDSPGIRKGDLLFCDKLSGAVLDTVRARGALGVLTDDSLRWNARRSQKELGDGVMWNNGALPGHNGENPVGIQLSPNQGEWVRRELEKRESISVHVDVRTRLYEDFLDVVTGILPGNGPGEVHVVAHLFEVGANDNASGVALSIEVCRAIKALEKKGVLNSRRRSIRLVFAMEVIGFTAYYESHPEVRNAAVNGLNLDMVGEDHDNCRSELWHCRTPDANGEFSDALVRRLLNSSFARHRWLRKKERAFIFNDNFISDPMIGIPCPFLGCVPDKYYHSDRDTPDKVSKETLLAIGGAVGEFLHTCSAGRLETAMGLLDDISVHARTAVASLTPNAAAPRGWFEYECAQAIRRMGSVDRLVFAESDRRRVARKRRMLSRALRSFVAAECGLAQRDRGMPKRTLPAGLSAWAARVIPRRTVFGPLTLSGIKDAGKWSPAWSYPLHAILYWMDGRRTLLDVWRNMDAEFKGYKLADVIGFVKFLKRHGYVRF